MAQAALETLRRGGRLFFTGCGATGRLSIQLDSIWRAFWQDRRARGLREAVARLLGGSDAQRDGRR